MADRLVVSRRAARQASVAAMPGAGAAGLGVRLIAYLIDSLALFGFTMVFASLAFLNIFLRSDAGQGTTTDEATWHSVILLIATVPAWALLNIVLAAKRGQTVGQYILGLQVQREDGGRPSIARLVLYWLALHPLLFHPLLAGFWLLFGYVNITLSQAMVITVFSIAVAVLCLVSPFVSLLMAITDPERRAVHDRIAGLMVTRLA